MAQIMDLMGMSPEDETLKCASLFSGSGGLDCGFHMQGSFKTVFALDKDKQAIESFRINFKANQYKFGTERSDMSDGPIYINYDIVNTNFGSPPVSSVHPDVIIGGPPCQDFSIVRGPERAKKGLKVKRGRLYAYFVKSLLYLEPKYFVFENVAGLKTENGGKSWDTIKEDFSNLSLHSDEIKDITGNDFKHSNLGYELIFSDIVDSSFHGVAQTRKRAIIIGVRRDLIADNNSLKDKLRNLCRIKLSGQDLNLSVFPMTTLEVLEGAPLPELREKYDKIMKEWKQQMGGSNLNKAKKWAGKLDEWYSGDAVIDYCTVNSINAASESELVEAFEQHKEILKLLGYYGRPIEQVKFRDKSNNTANEKKTVLRRMAFIPVDENYKFLASYKKFRVEGKGISFIYKRIHPLKPAYTVVAKGGGGTYGYHYTHARSRLTNRERARLQSFPDWFEFSGTYQQQRSQIGDAVPPLLGKAIAETIYEINAIIFTTGGNK